MADKPIEFAEARIKASFTMPYLTTGLMALQPVRRPGLGTMAVDKYGRCYYDPEWLGRQPVEDAAFVVLHETLHVVLRHARRARDIIGERPAESDRRLWNIACDMVVNQSLLSTLQPSKQLSEGIITHRRYGLPPNLTAAEYYALLRQQKEGEDGGQGEEDGQAGAQGNQQSQSAEADDDSQRGDGQAGGQSPAGSTGQSENKQADESAGQPSDQGEPESGGNGGDASEAGGEAGGTSGSGARDESTEGGAAAGGPQPDTSDGAPYSGPSPSETPGEAGSASDGVPKPWEAPAPKNGTGGDPGGSRPGQQGPSEVPGMEEYELDGLAHHVAKQIEEWHSSGRGTVPGNLLREARRIVRPKVDPIREFAAKCRFALSQTTGFGEYTYRRPNRRTPPGVGVVMPAHRQPVPNATLIVDTSASMEDRDVGLAMGVVAQAVKALPNQAGVHVIAGDTYAAAAKRVFRPEQVELAGGGGTDMGNIIEYAATQKPRPDVIFVITDGETPWGTEPPGIRVVACLTRRTHFDQVPAWIDAVCLEEP